MHITRLEVLDTQSASPGVQEAEMPAAAANAPKQRQQPAQELFREANVRLTWSTVRRAVGAGHWLPAVARLYGGRGA